MLYFAKHKLLPMPAAHLIVKGKVQGVFYRASAKKMADSMGITGWVRNTDAGHVEILATGSAGNLEKFTEWCKQGPPKAAVANIAVTNKDEGDFDGFEIRR